MTNKSSRQTPICVTIKCMHTLKCFCEIWGVFRSKGQHEAGEVAHTHLPVSGGRCWAR